MKPYVPQNYVASEIQVTTFRSGLRWCPVQVRIFHLPTGRYVEGVFQSEIEGKTWLMKDLDTVLGYQSQLVNDGS